MDNTTLRPMNASEQKQVNPVPLPRVGSGLVQGFVYGIGLWLALLIFTGRSLRRYVQPETFMTWSLVVCMLLGFIYVRYRDHRERHRDADKERERLAVDRERGQVEEWRVRVRDAMKVWPVDDEPSHYYLELEDGRVLFLDSRFLDEEW